ncbi:hypothetical protein EXN22_11200 [Pseudomonas tructae]|uniref:Uncharacterized protein n=1 Tax=Pseudomonas tructae TaxID=2518644 RepID=A0A411MHA3_9PSED|nr:hypothetical protein [Pseudomonas tructae]QBF26232.1 hypothetical protein EXN22_11200 [Pseudomonas tructae]
MGREEWLLVEAIQIELDSASDALYKLDNLEQHLDVHQLEDPEDNRHDMAQQILRYHLEASFRGIGVLAERLGAPSIEREVADSRKNRTYLEKTGRPFDGEIHSEALAQAYACFAPLRAMSNAKAITTHEVLRNILLKTAVIISDRDLRPKNESEVRNAVLEICRYSFTDAMREVGVPKIIKHTKGDIGIPSLRTMVEFKFIDSKAEMKASLDGVYADMKGYNHPDWDTFYGVFYMTQPFYTQDEVEKEFELVNADKTWKPIVVNGAGGRIKPVK